MKLIVQCVILLYSWSVFAADVPQDEIGAQHYENQQCIDNNTQTCINSSCLNSEQIDCQDNCHKMAQEKCQQESNE